MVASETQGQAQIREAFEQRGWEADVKRDADGWVVKFKRQHGFGADERRYGSVEDALAAAGETLRRGE